jgi:hypothetical protein
MSLPGRIIKLPNGNLAFESASVANGSNIVPVDHGSLPVFGRRASFAHIVLSPP